MTSHDPDRTPEEQRMLDALMSADYPIPDPAWDYAAIWPQIWRLEQQTTKLRELVQEAEEESSEVDRQAKSLLTGIRAEAERILKLMDGEQR